MLRILYTLKHWAASDSTVPKIGMLLGTVVSVQLTKIPWSRQSQVPRNQVHQVHRVAAPSLQGLLQVGPTLGLPVHGDPSRSPTKAGSCLATQSQLHKNSAQATKYLQRVNQSNAANAAECIDWCGAVLAQGGRGFYRPAIKIQDWQLRMHLPFNGSSISSHPLVSASTTVLSLLFHSKEEFCALKLWFSTWLIAPQFVAAWYCDLQKHGVVALFVTPNQHLQFCIQVSIGG